MEEKDGRMMKGRWWQILCLVVLCLGAAAARADLAELGCYVQGSTLAGGPAYEWWYGCSPTAAGMMMGYYDGKGYTNLVPGTAEPSTFPSTPGTWAYNAQYAIASPEHVADFYVRGIDRHHDDVKTPFHSFNCLADFMGTSQDSAGNPNGATTFYHYTNGAPLYYGDLLGTSDADLDGMYGIWEYIDYSGYGVTSLYTQPTDNLGLTYGFTFEDYKDEIDAGRVVMIHVEGHSMFGYGYEEDGSLSQIILGDTWSSGLHTMVWGGLYSGRALWGVTVLELAPVPVPAAVLLGMLGLAAAGLQLRKYA